MFVSTLWLGLVIGVSFLATPVKFQAPSLDLPTALDVGRVTFAAFAKVEWGLTVLLAAAAAAAGRGRPAWIRWSCVVLIAAMVAAQSAWLLPVLDDRVGRIMAGGSVPAGPHHLVYVAMETGKVVLLAALSLAALSGVRAARRDAECA